MVYLVFLLLLVTVLAFPARMLSILLHELGHAIAAMALTRQKVTIYLGSYGDPNGSTRFRLGLLEVYFRNNPMLWQGGLCVPAAKSISAKSQFIYTLMGPLTSLAVASMARYFAFHYGLNDIARVFLLLLFVFAALDLLMNLPPRRKRVKLHNSEVTYNDGYFLLQLIRYLLQLIRHPRVQRQYAKAVEFHNNQQYLQALRLIEKMPKHSLRHKEVVQLAVGCYYHQKAYEAALRLVEQYVPLDQASSDELSSIALMYSHVGRYERALEVYDLSLEQNVTNVVALSNKAYTLNLMARFEEAIVLFDRAIALGGALAYLLSNRGLAKLKLGETEAGLEDINQSFELDASNSYGCTALGIYHSEQGNYQEALRLFTKARNSDPETYLIDQWITDTERHISKCQPAV